MKSISTFLFLFLLTPLFSQYSIYSDASTIITGVWANTNNGTATLNEVSSNNPYEGTLHYEFTYDYSDWWAGTGLNFDNWGNDAPLDLSGYSHLRIAYRGLSNSGETMVVQLLGTGGEVSNNATVGSMISNYNVVDIPITSLVGGTSVSMNQITGMQINMNGVFATAGTLYFDAIELVNVETNASAASAATWARANSVTRGFNTANWLEAHWLIQFGTYPETNKYNASNIQALKAAGFDVIRLPVTFERFTPTDPPYTIPTNHESMQLIDDMIAWAVQYDFKLIIDNHHGYDITNDNYQTELPRLKAIWEQLAIRYGDLDPERYFFEVYNEAHLISNANLRPFYTEIIDVIRMNETQTHSILIGATGYNSGYDLVSFTPLADENIIYTFHTYDPYFFTHQGMSWTTPPYFDARVFPQAGEVDAINDLFASVAAWSATWDVPVWLGEYGVSTAADATSRCNWIETLETATAANNIVPFYWDAISDTDAFGFFDNAVVSEATAIPCFVEAMGLYESVLSVHDVNFEVDCDKNEIRLFQPVYSDATYTLQSSQDGLDWQTERIFTAKMNEDWYRFNIEKFAPYYRLQSLETDGRTSYSSVINVPCPEEANDWVLYPNPTQHVFSIETTINERYFDVQLYDVAGRKVQEWKDCQSRQTLSLHSYLPGVYMVKIYSGLGGFATRRLVVY